MSGRAVVAVAVALLAAPALPAAGGAQRKDGGSSSTKTSSTSAKSSGTSAKSSSASSRSSSASPRSSSSRSGERSSVSSGRSRASRPPTTGAQRRHPRPGTGSGTFDLPYLGGESYGGYYLKNYRGPRYPSYAYPYYFSPFYQPGYGYVYGYGPYRSGYGFAPYSSYGYSGSSVVIGPGVTFGGGGASLGEEEEEEEAPEGTGSLRLLVEPEKTRVFVNGNYAGLVEDYDGILQRLRLPARRQQITLRLDGHTTQHFTVDLADGETVKIEHRMVRGFGEAASDEYAGRPVGYARLEEEPAQRYEAFGGMVTVRLSVRPEDASVYVDGAFHGTGGATAVALAPGRHRIEVVRPGYRTVERDLDVAAGDTAEIDVELERN